MTPESYIRSARVLDCAGELELASIGRSPVRLKPSMIEVIRSVPDTTVNLIDGSAMTLRDTPERIVEMIAERPRSLTRRAWAYIHVKYALESGRSPQDLLCERKERVAAIIRNVVDPSPRPSGLSRLAVIYASLLIPFLSPFKVFRRQ